mmetsp:Transcript_10815/g.28969  ORF Transcript_10815/g.28969 Transcript_10815/m.28969 type:complete len:87 (+) Transcript_10815:1103-1363(+)
MKYIVNSVSALCSPQQSFFFFETPLSRSNAAAAALLWARGCAAGEHICCVHYFGREQSDGKVQITSALAQRRGLWLVFSRVEILAA